MKDSRDRHWVKLLVKTRRLVETSSGELRRASHGKHQKMLPESSILGRTEFVAEGTHWTTERTFSPAKC